MSTCANCKDCTCGKKSYYETPEKLTPGATYQLVENNTLKGKVYLVGFAMNGDAIVHFIDSTICFTFSTTHDSLKRV